MKNTVSVLICTRNRAAVLQQTLAALVQVRIPAACQVEILVVDNASTDETAAVVASAKLHNMKLQYLHEPKPGQSNARNTGLKAAHGEIILFTDDDVVPATDWLEHIVAPLAVGQCDAVVGHIELASYLCRPWMKPQHKLWLAATVAPTEGQLELIGANMGFHRCVLDRVPAFDPELGPGALGFGDDTLFSWQLCKAGFRIRAIPEAKIVHHPDPTRLLRCHWLDAARKRGQTQAYLHHHWWHRDINLNRFDRWYLLMKLSLRRRIQPPPAPKQEGCPSWEISYVGGLAMSTQFQLERQRPRNYPQHGLKKLSFRAATPADGAAVARTVPGAC